MHYFLRPTVIILLYYFLVVKILIFRNPPVVFDQFHFLQICFADISLKNNILLFYLSQIYPTRTNFHSGAIY